MLQEEWDLKCWEKKKRIKWLYNELKGGQQKKEVEMISGEQVKFLWEANQNGEGKKE